jgi:hypothetical protein
MTLWMIVQALALAESLQLSLDEEGTLLPLLARSWGKNVLRRGTQPPSKIYLTPLSISLYFSLFSQGASKILGRCGDNVAQAQGNFYAKALEHSNAPLKNLGT